MKIGGKCYEKTNQYLIGISNGIDTFHRTYGFS